MTPHWLLGLDLGQQNDPSALATLEDDADRLILRALERFPLGTSYTAYPRLLAAHLAHLGPGPAVLAVDATGPGAPVVDALREARLPLRLLPITITGGQSPTRSTAPRAALIANLLRHRLVVPARFAAWPALRQELLQLDPAGRSVAHDDMVLALALAAWAKKFVHSKSGWQTASYTRLNLGENTRQKKENE